MRPPRLYHPEKLAVGERVSLTSLASQHLLRVLRHPLQALLIVFNGEGGEYEARLIEVKKQQAIIEILEFSPCDVEPPLSLHLAQGICRGEKMDWVIQKAVELGVTEITPLFTEYGNVQLDNQRLEKRWQHWKNIAISACEQSGRCKIPAIHQPLFFKEWIERPQSGLLITLDPGADKRLSQIQLNSKTIIFVIGPEGGLSPQEIDIMRKHDFQAIRLGPRILRTETAGLAMIAALQTLFGDF